MSTILGPRTFAGPNATLIPSDLKSVNGHQPPTLASLWHAVSASSITADLLEWPPDLFALTDVILEHSEAHRFAWSPPNGSSWPPDGSVGWADAVVEAGRQWGRWVE
jgi:hypothetical protein